MDEDLRHQLATAIERHAPRLRATAERILHDASEAEDAVQDACVSALRSLDRFRGDARMSTWLHRITVNAALMRLRRRKRRAVHVVEWELDGSLLEAPGAVALDRRVEQRAQLARTDEALASLPPRYRQALQLWVIEDRSVGEIARELGTTRGGVKLLVHRARKALRKSVAAPARPGVAGSASVREPEPRLDGQAVRVSGRDERPHVEAFPVAEPPLRRVAQPHRDTRRRPARELEAALGR